FRRALPFLQDRLVGWVGRSETHQVRASRIARHSFSGVAGSSTGGAPIAASALLTAFITAGIAPIVPASPTPLTPSGFLSVGVEFSSNSNEQKSSARGIP